MALSFVIMRLTRYLLRYRGTKNGREIVWWKNVDIVAIFPVYEVEK